MKNLMKILFNILLLLKNWYIIIILTLVYWSSYKIIKEYSWISCNLKFLLFINNNATLIKSICESVEETQKNE